MSFLEQVKQAREKAKKRKFSQSFDLAINLKNIDLKKPENRLNLEFLLPEGRGKSIKIAVIADALSTSIKDDVDFIIKKQEIDPLSKNKKRLKKIVKEYDWFLGEAPLMPQIGKTLGTVLGPQGKMPKPIPPAGNIKPIIEATKKSVRIRVKDSPVIHVSVGTDGMTDENVEKNVTTLISFVRDKLPKGLNNIRSVYLKLTMGPPVKLEVR